MTKPDTKDAQSRFPFDTTYDQLKTGDRVRASWDERGMLYAMVFTVEDRTEWGTIIAEGGETVYPVSGDTVDGQATNYIGPTRTYTVLSRPIARPPAYDAKPLSMWRSTIDGRLYIRCAEQDSFALLDDEGDIDQGISHEQLMSSLVLDEEWRLEQKVLAGVYAGDGGRWHDHGSMNRGDLRREDMFRSLDKLKAFERMRRAPNQTFPPHVRRYPFSDETLKEPDPNAAQF